MQMINMLPKCSAFQICTEEGILKYPILEILFIKHGEKRNYAKETTEYIEYKMRVQMDRFGQFRTHIVWYVKNKEAWYIMDECEDLFYPEAAVEFAQIR